MQNALQTTVVGAHRVRVSGAKLSAFEVTFKPHLPSGHPGRYVGIPRRAKPEIVVAIKAVVREALAS